MRRVQTRVLRVDRHEHLHDVVFRQPVEDDRRYREILTLEPLDVGVQREQPMLTVDCAQNPFALRHLQDAHALVLVGGLEGELLVAGNDDGTGNRRQVARLAALFVVLHELVDFLADDLPLIGFLTRGDPPFEKIPVHFRRRHARLLTAAADRVLRIFAVAEDLEADKLIYVAGRERSLVELHPELLHPDRGNIDHRLKSWTPLAGPRVTSKEANCSERRAAISTIFSPLFLNYTQIRSSVMSQWRRPSRLLASLFLSFLTLRPGIVAQSAGTTPVGASAVANRGTVPPGIKDD